MAKFVTLYKLTDQGVRNIKNAPERIRQAKAVWEATGGELLAVYSIMGPYDYITISESEDDEAAAAFSLGVSALGNVTTLTMRAFDTDEFERIVATLP